VEWSKVVSAKLWQPPALVNINSKVAKYVVLEVNIDHLPSVLDQIEVRNAFRKQQFWPSLGKNVSLYLSLDAFTRENDRAMFISYICRHLDSSQLDETLNAENRLNKEADYNDAGTDLRPTSSPGQSPTYTDIWLDDMHSARRRSVEALRPGQKLQENRYSILEK